MEQIYRRYTKYSRIILKVTFSAVNADFNNMKYKLIILYCHFIQPLSFGCIFNEKNFICIFQKEKKCSYGRNKLIDCCPSCFIHLALLLWTCKTLFSFLVPPWNDLVHPKMCLLYLDGLVCIRSKRCGYIV